MKYIRHLFSLTLLFMVAVWPSPTRAETLDCTPIPSLPAVITTQGIYCFTGNLSTNMASGNAIEIQTNNVTIDLNGYKLGGLGAGNNTHTIGIYAEQRKNITIKNGIVRGFFVGIMLFEEPLNITTSSGHVVKDILADQNTFAGIAVYGLGCTVQNNKVVNTGGSTVTSQASGISVYGAGVKVLNNSISTTTAQGTNISSGIFVAMTEYPLVQNNTVTDTIRDTGTSYAIYIATSTGVLLRNNNLANADFGLYFNPSGSGSSGKYFNNLTFDITTPFTGGTAIGSNNN